MEEKQLEDYQVRFIDEYRTLCERCSKLHSMLVKYDAGLKTKMLRISIFVNGFVLYVVHITIEISTQQ